MPDFLPSIWRPIEQDLREVFAWLKKDLCSTGCHQLKQLFDPLDDEYLFPPGMVLYSAGLFSQKNEQHLPALFMELIYLGMEFHVRAGDLGLRKEKQMLILTGDLLSSHLFNLVNKYEQRFLLETFTYLTTSLSEGHTIRESYKIMKRDPDKKESEEWLYKQYGVFYGEACFLGGLFAGADTQDRALLREFGTVFGIAYGAYKNQCSLLSVDEYLDIGLNKLSQLSGFPERRELISFVQEVFATSIE